MTSLKLDTLALFSASKQMQTIYEHHELGDDSGSLSESMKYKETVDAAQLAFQQARTSLTLTAAVNVIMEMKGQLQIQGATTLLKDKRGLLPKSIIGELECICAGTTSSSSGVKRPIADVALSESAPLSDVTNGNKNQRLASTDCLGTETG